MAVAECTSLELNDPNGGKAEIELSIRTARSYTASTDTEQSVGRDSGYASMTSNETPESACSEFFEGIVIPSSTPWLRKPTKLIPYERQLPQATWNRFNDFIELFNESLSDELARCKYRFRFPSIKLKVLGSNEDDAKPWIVVLCDKQISRKVQRFFDRKNVKAEYKPVDSNSSIPSFEVVVCNRPPRQIAATLPIHVYGEVKPSTQEFQTLCGTIVRVNQGEEERMATIGGIVKVSTVKGTTLYGMTAGHILAQENCETGSEYDGSDEDEDDTDTDYNISYSERQSFELCLGFSEEPQGAAHVDIDHVKKQQSQDNSHLGTDSSWPKMGNIEVISQNSPDGVNRDWALASFSDPSLLLPNRLITPFNGVCRIKERENPGSDLGGLDRDVFVLSGVSGLKAGKLTFNYSYITLPPGKKLVRTFSFHLDGGSELALGDCGSWVVGALSFEVYGHVVATDAFNEAYVVPIEDTLDQIKMQLSAETVCVATQEDIDAARHTKAQAPFEIVLIPAKTPTTTTTVPDVPKFPCGGSETPGDVTPFTAAQNGLTSTYLYDPPYSRRQTSAGIFFPDVHEAPYDLGAPEIEMESCRPRVTRGGGWSSTSTSTLFTSNQSTPQSFETQSFLHDPLNKTEARFFTPEYQPYKDHTGRQLRHILIKSLGPWLITLLLCALYILTTRVWVGKEAISGSQKKFYNAITTAISLALGLNIASAFKNMALNMRWPILGARKRNLRELDIILRADRISELFKLVFTTRRFWVVAAFIAWLLLNVLAQASIAMISLTYSFEVNPLSIIHSLGTVQTANMEHFFLEGNATVPSQQDEQYVAHMYGGLIGSQYDIGDIGNKPKSGDICNVEHAMLWDNGNTGYLEFVFFDEPVDSPSNFAVYTDRSINVTYDCEVHEVIGSVDSVSNEIQVANIGNLSINNAVPDAITYFTSPDNACFENSARCSIVEAVELSTLETSYYYRCNITMGNTEGDYYNISYISDMMASYASKAIAQSGYKDMQSPFYPKGSTWGRPARGDRNSIGFRVASFALRSIASASRLNPKKTFEGLVPSQTFRLSLTHRFLFYLLIGLLCASQLVLHVVVAVLTNRVKAGPDGPLSMSLLLRPIADALEGVSGGRENRAYETAKKQYHVRYEKSRSGRWVLAIS